jgi:hypothetical protein
MPMLLLLAFLVEAYCRWVWFRTGARLEKLRQRALLASEDEVCAAAIDCAHALLLRLERRGFVSRAQRLELCRNWILAYTRDLLPELYRSKDAGAVNRWGRFLTLR